MARMNQCLTTKQIVKVGEFIEYTKELGMMSGEAVTLQINQEWNEVCIIRASAGTFVERRILRHEEHTFDLLKSDCFRV